VPKSKDPVLGPAPGGKPARRSLFRDRNFAILVTGQWISSIGNNLFDLAVFWFVLSITHRPSDLGWVGVAMALPGILGLFSGVLVDRADRRRVMMGADLVRAVLALALGALAYFHRLPLLLLLVLVLALMAAGTTFSPAVMALVPQIVEPDDLPRANGTLASTLQSANLVGLLGGGVLMAALGPVLLFVGDGVSFLVSVGSLLLMKTPPLPRIRSQSRTRAQDLLADWKEGVRVLWSVPLLRRIIVVGVFVNFVFQGVNVLAAAWVKGPLHGNAFDYALLGVAETLGIILGGLSAQPILKRLTLTRTLPSSLALMGLAVVVLASLPSIGVSFAMVLVLGLNTGILSTGLMTAMQSNADPSMLGRVFGSFGALVTVANPAGAATFGGLAAFWPLSFIFLVVGLAVAAASLPLFRRPAAPAEAGAA
jgi:DHA3 family macrolide efflux protein-like MFS transporter